MFLLLFLILLLPSICKAEIVIDEFHSMAGDGFVYNSGSNFSSGSATNEMWNSCHDGVEGDGVLDDYWLMQTGVSVGNFDPGGRLEIDRLFIPIDTTNIPLKAEIASASLRLFTIVKINDYNLNDWLTIVEADQASNSELNVDDYSKCGSIFSPAEGTDHRINFSEIEPGQWVSFKLNKIGLGWIKKNGITKLGIREGDDVVDALPVITGSQFNVIKFYSSEYEDESKRPYLEVTYEIPDEPEINPVVLIPGFGASWQSAGEWKIDPILHTYDNLIEALTSNIYELNDNFFLFPYNWRNDIKDTAELLHTEIGRIKASTTAGKVDIVAHSMGSLVAREYVRGYGEDDNIDQIIFLNAPHQGSPESYLLYEGAYFRRPFDQIAKYALTVESLANGYLSLPKYLQEEIISIKQLLPTDSYLFNKENGIWSIMPYPDNYPRNILLEDLNTSEALTGLKSQAQITNIISYLGDTQTSTTLNGLKVVDVSNIYVDQWMHGMPYLLNTDSQEGFTFGQGDGTVPFSSLDHLEGVDRVVYSDVSHSGLVTRSQKEIIRILTGEETNLYVSGPWSAIKRVLFTRVYSPVDMLLIDNNTGQKTGYDIEHEEEFSQIPGSFYSGNNIELEFATVPKPAFNDYTIRVIGTDAGIYKVGVDLLEDREKFIEREFSFGVISKGDVEEFNFVLTEEGGNEFKIIKSVDFGTVKKDINELFDLGEIKKWRLKKLLLIKMKILEKKFNRLENTGQSKNIKRKKQVIKFALKIIKKTFKFYERRNWLSKDAYKVLVDDVDGLIALL